MAIEERDVRPTKARDVTAGSPPEAPAAAWEAERRRTASPSTLRRAVTVVVAAAVAVVLVRAMLVQTFVIPSGSMEPTLRVGDRVLVSPAITTLRGVHRGDIVVFDGSGVFDPLNPPPTSALARAGRAVAAAAGVPVGARDYVKRVIGLPGDRVACCDDVGRLTGQRPAAGRAVPALGRRRQPDALRCRRAAGQAMGDGRPPQCLRRLPGPPR